MNKILLVCLCVLLSACGTESELGAKKKPADPNIRGADLGAPAPQDQDPGDLDNDLAGLPTERPIERDIIVKNANTDDEMLVSRPTRRRPPVEAPAPDNAEKNNKPDKDKAALHKGQMVGDFAKIDSIDVPGYQTIYFRTLSAYVYFQEHDDMNHPGADMTLYTQLHKKTDAAKGDLQIPKAIRDLHGKKIAIPGFMLPAEKMVNGETDDFLLVQVLPSCFFCKIPNVTEWVSCKSKDGVRFPYHANKPVLVIGTIEVGANYLEDDYLDSIYRITVDDVRLLD